MGLQSPHQGQPVATAGRPLTDAKAAMILIHGRGATAESILALAQELAHPDMAYLAPQAAGNSWYPYSFLQDIDNNEPGLSSGLAAIHALVEQAEAAGIPPERVMIGGFSQGACLSLEYVARNARRYGGVFAYSGGLIGPEGTPRNYGGSLEMTPIFIGCSDVDAHIPKARVLESDTVLKDLGASLDTRLYRGMGHTVNQDELDAVNAILGALMSSVE
jgi:predicted esterase